VTCDWVIAGGFYIHWCAELEEFKRIRVLKEVENFAEIFFIDEGPTHHRLQKVASPLSRVGKTASPSH